MPIVDTSLKRLKKLIKGKATTNQIDQCLADMGMELDSIEGDEIKIEVTPERTDLMTPEGLARAINMYLGFTKKYPEVKVNKSKYVHRVSPSVKKYREFTRSFIVKGIKFKDEDIKALMWIQEKLHETYGRKRKKMALGVYDLDKINFPVTYTVMKPNNIKFIPLGMNKELTGKQILTKHPTGRDYAHLIIKDDKYPIQIDAKKQILSMPPIINSEDLGKIETSTKNIFVECTGPDSNTLDATMNIIATMFNDWGGKVYSITIQEGEKKVICPNLKPKKNSVTKELVKNLIGLDLPIAQIKKCITKMGYNVITNTKEKITVEIPATRTDIWHPVDLADDVARGYGYNNIKPTLPNVQSMAEMLPINILKEDICNFLASQGLMEVKTFALTNEEDQYEKMGIEPTPHITLGADTAEKGINMVRSWMIPELLKSLKANRSSEYPQRIYESGIIVLPDTKADVKSKNVERLAILLCEEKADFTRIKQVLDSLMDFLDLQYEINETEHDSFIPGRVGRISVKGKDIAYIGEIHPQVLSNWEIAMPVAALELNLTEILNK